MGEIADDHIDRMIEDDWFAPCEPREYRHARYSHQLQRPKKAPPKGAFDEQTRATEFPGKKTPAHLLQDYPEKTFDMGFFPSVPKKGSINEPKSIQELLDEDDSPF